MRFYHLFRITIVGILAGIAVAAMIATIGSALLGVKPSDVLAKISGSSSDNKNATTTNSGIPRGAPIGGPFQLTDQSGQSVTASSYRGKYMLVFFGYSHCPDDCPLTLQKIARALQSLGPLSQYIAPIFITIDPARDTPATLNIYLKNFGPEMIGLTGSMSQIASVAHEYGVSFDTNRLEASGASLINHSTYIYLMGPDEKFLNLFPETITIQQLVSALKAQVDQG